MKRVKSACIMQTLVFSQKEEPGRSRDSILKLNRDEFEHLKHISNDPELDIRSSMKRSGRTAL